jgi:alpha 1,3-glucosidase
VGVQWIAESGVMDLYVFTGGSAASVLASYAKMSGEARL